MSMKFGAIATDHMLEIDYDKSKGWGKPIIREFQPFLIHPFNTTLHYAIECFEGKRKRKKKTYF
jgi:branched-chain amino acid aminotransferase